MIGTFFIYSNDFVNIKSSKGETYFLEARMSFEFAILSRSSDILGVCSLYNEVAAIILVIKFSLRFEYSSYLNVDINLEIENPLLCNSI